jgi:hypothetical protein
MIEVRLIADDPGLVNGGCRCSPRGSLQVEDREGSRGTGLAEKFTAARRLALTHHFLPFILMVQTLTSRSREENIHSR